MSQIDAIISKMLKQKQSSEEGSCESLNEFAMDIEFPHTQEEECEK